MNLIELQKAFVEKYIFKPDELADDEKCYWTERMILAMFAELVELLDSMPWKHWKKQQMLDKENIKIELIDLQHFLNELYIIWGLTEDDVITLYKEKMAENIKRQENGY